MTVEKEEKPKKLFKLEFIVWDDGEIQRDMVEYVYGDRGAPKQWRMEPKELVKSMTSQVGGKLELFSALMAAMDVRDSELAKMFNIEHSVKRIPKDELDAMEDDTEEEDLDFD